MTPREASDRGGDTVAQHTPGPWWYQEKSDAYTHIVRTGENRFLCQLAQDTSGEAEANARLIAAAPDLLAALQEMVVVFQRPTEVSRIAALKQARAAISRALG
jgi:hypothetical protein